MNKNPFYAFLFALLLCRGSGFPAIAGSPDELTIAPLHVTFQEQDPVLPWIQLPPGNRGGYAIFIRDHVALTTDSLIRNHRFIEVQDPRTGKKTAATVIQSDIQANLALIQLNDPASLPDVRPMKIAGQIGMKDKFTLLQLDESLRPQHGKTTPLRIGISQSSTSPYGKLTFTLLSDLSVDGEGAPVISGNKLAGLVVNYDPVSRTMEMIPSQTIARFVEDAENPPYAGFASAGFRWSALLDPVKRSYLGIPDDDGGILVMSCIPDTGAMGTLKPMDVIREWDGHSIDSRGFYRDPVVGQIEFSHLIRGHRRPGDTVPVQIIRNRAPVSVQIPLTRYRDEQALIPENFAGEPEEYLVEGGLFFRELTGRFMRGHGSQWTRSLPTRLVYLYRMRAEIPEHPGDRIPILAGVLPDSINIGYQDIANEMVTAVNGEPVRSIKDIFRIADRDGHIHRISLKNVKVDLVLDPRQLPQANHRIINQYGLPSLRYPSPSRQPEI